MVYLCDLLPAGQRKALTTKDTKETNT